MRSIAAILIMTLCSLLASGQRRVAEDDPQWRKETVQRAFDEVSAGLRTSWSEKYLARLGDSAAPEIMRCVSSKEITDKDVGTAVSLVKMAFADPRLIRRNTARVPTNSLALLDYLGKHTTDAGRESEIDSIRRELRGESPSSTNR